MTVLKVWYDKEKTKKADMESLVFDPVPVGETTIKTLYIENTIKYPVTLKIDFEANDLTIKNKEITIDPKSIEAVEFIFSPKITSVKPIKGKVKFNIEWIIS